MSKRTQAGFTIINLLISIPIMVMMLLALGKSYDRTQEINVETRRHLRANEDLRRNLEALANVLRGVDIDTFGGVDAQGVSTTPTFAHVVGADKNGQVLGPTQSITWEAADEELPTGVRGGNLIHTMDGDRNLIAARVPEDGFRLRLDSGVIHIECQTYYVIRGQQALARGETAVLPRN